MPRRPGRPRAAARRRRPRPVPRRRTGHRRLPTHQKPSDQPEQRGNLMRHTHNELDWANVRAGIEGQVELLASAPHALYAHVAEALTGDAPSRVYFVGCGDSYFCGLATRYATELASGITTEALESLEFSRYAIRTAPEDALVVAV